MKRNNISKKFRTVRSSLGMTQAEMSRLLNVCRVSLSNYETGTTNPSAKTYAKLLNLDFILKGKQWKQR